MREFAVRDAALLLIAHLLRKDGKGRHESVRVAEQMLDDTIKGKRFDVPTLNDVVQVPKALSDEELMRIARDAHFEETKVSGTIYIPEWVLAAMRKAQRHPAILDMVDAAEEFVVRVESGEVRSQRTYKRFKQALRSLV